MGQNMQYSKEWFTKLEPYFPHFIDHMKLSGCLYYYNKSDKQFIDHIPFAALPYRFPKLQFQKLRARQITWAKLLTKVAADKQFLNKTLSAAIENDQFVRNLLRISNQNQNPQKIGVNILRNDYMLDKCKNKSLMIEYNLMAVSLTCICQRCQNVQKQLLCNYFPNDFSTDGFPVCNNTDVICDAMIEAIKEAGLKGKIIMITKEVQNNIYDQRIIQFGILKRGNQIIRSTFKDLAQNLKLNQDTLEISYKNQPIALFYLRDGYMPQTYESQEIWNVRVLIQKSMALSVPTVAMQIANTKRVQQQLCNKQALLRYISQSQAQQLKQNMADMSNFQDQSTFQNKVKGRDCKQLILKPNREGGNNNTFGQDIVKLFEKLSPKEREQYILMQKICPVSSPNIFFKNNESTNEQQTISEISLLSSLIYRQGQLVKSVQGGHLIRTKNVNTNQGGIAIQASVLSGLYLID